MSQFASVPGQLGFLTLSAENGAVLSSGGELQVTLRGSLQYLS